MAETDNKQPAELGPDILNAIGAAVQEAVGKATTAEEGASAGRAAAKETAAANGWADIPEEILKGISDASAAATVAKLREEYEIENPTSGTGSTEPPAPGVSGTSESGSPEGTPAPALPSSDGPAPRKTLAERLLGL